MSRSSNFRVWVIGLTLVAMSASGLGATSSTPAIATPRYIAIVAGEWQAGTVDSVVARDGDRYAVAPQYAVDPSSGSALATTEIVVGMQASSRAHPRHVALAFETAGCFTLDLGLRRWGSGTTIDPDPVDVVSASAHCLGDEMQTIAVSADLPASSGVSPYVDDRGMVEVVLTFVTEVGSTSGQEGSDRHIDEVTVETDY